MRLSNLTAGSIASLVAIAPAHASAPVTSNNPPGVQYMAVLPSNNVISGSIVASSAPNGTGLNFQISVSGLPSQGGPFLYSVNTNPVSTNGSCSTIGRILNPYNATGSAPCGGNSTQTCQVGDLSGKHGNMTGPNFSANYEELFMSTTMGSPVFVGNRSVAVESANKTVIACANFSMNGAFLSGPSAGSASGPSTAANVIFTSFAVTTVTTVSGSSIQASSTRNGQVTSPIASMVPTTASMGIEISTVTTSITSSTTAISNGTSQSQLSKSPNIVNITVTRPVTVVATTPPSAAAATSSNAALPISGTPATEPQFSAPNSSVISSSTSFPSSTPLPAPAILSSTPGVIPNFTPGLNGPASTVMLPGTDTTATTYISVPAMASTVTIGTTWTVTTTLDQTISMSGSTYTTTIESTVTMTVMTMQVPHNSSVLPSPTFGQNTQPQTTSQLQNSSPLTNSSLPKLTSLDQTQTVVIPRNNTAPQITIAPQITSEPSSTSLCGDAIISTDPSGQILTVFTSPSSACGPVQLTTLPNGSTITMLEATNTTQTVAGSPTVGGAVVTFPGSTVTIGPGITGSPGPASPLSTSGTIPSISTVTTISSPSISLSSSSASPLPVVITFKGGPTGLVTTVPQSIITIQPSPSTLSSQVTPQIVTIVTGPSSFVTTSSPSTSLSTTSSVSPVVFTGPLGLTITLPGSQSTFTTSSAPSTSSNFSPTVTAAPVLVVLFRGGPAGTTITVPAAAPSVVSVPAQATSILTVTQGLSSPGIISTILGGLLGQQVTLPVVPSEVTIPAGESSTITLPGAPDSPQIGITVPIGETSIVTLDAAPELPTDLAAAVETPAVSIETAAPDAPDAPDVPVDPSNPDTPDGPTIETKKVGGAARPTLVMRVGANALGLAIGAMMIMF